MQMSADKFTLSPSLNYQIVDSVRLVTTMSLDSEYESKMAIGAEYDFS